MIDPDILEAFEKYKKAKKRLECEITYLMSILPDEIQAEIHYNGKNAKSLYPEYAKIVDELVGR